MTANNFRSMVPTMVSKTPFHFLVHYLHRPEYDIPKTPFHFLVHYLHRPEYDIPKTTFHFLVHYLHRPEYDIPTGQDDNVRQTIMLAEEFLNLLLIILGNVIFIYRYIKRKKSTFLWNHCYSWGSIFMNDENFVRR